MDRVLSSSLSKYQQATGDTPQTINVVPQQVVQQQGTATLRDALRNVAFGRGSTGGVVNHASKTPEVNRIISADLQFATDATRRAASDFNTPLGVSAAFRLNVFFAVGSYSLRI
jgi:outer membrane receptor for monomeric catechols